MSSNMGKKKMIDDFMKKNRITSSYNLINMLSIVCDLLLLEEDYLEQFCRFDKGFNENIYAVRTAFACLRELSIPN